MTKEQLLIELDAMTSLRENRMHVSNLVLEHKESFEHLLEITFYVNNKISIKAAWALEFVCKQKINWLYKHLDYFTEHLKKAHYGSVVRPLAKICELLLLQNNKTPILLCNIKHKEQIAEIAFDWLISDHKVAIKAYSMTTLFLLGKEIDWIHDELKKTILSDINHSSKAFEARGKYVLREIEKYNLRR